MLISDWVLLDIRRIVGKQRKEDAASGMVDAIVVGLAQVLPLMPGASRSGRRSSGGLLAGAKRETAARFSFSILYSGDIASGLLELREAVKILPPEQLCAALVATVVSAVVGYLAIWFLIAFLRSNSTAIFVVYRLVLGAVILGLLWYGLLDPVVT